MRGQRVGELWGCLGRLCCCVSGVGSVEVGLSAAAVSLLQVIREGSKLGRKDVMSCVSSPMEARLLFILWVGMSQTTWVVMGASLRVLSNKPCSEGSAYEPWMS